VRRRGTAPPVLLADHPDVGGGATGCRSSARRMSCLRESSDSFGTRRRPRQRSAANAQRSSATSTRSPRADVGDCRQPRPPRPTVFSERGHTPTRAGTGPCVGNVHAHGWPRRGGDREHVLWVASRLRAGVVRRGVRQRKERRRSRCGTRYRRCEAESVRRAMDRDSSFVSPPRRAPRGHDPVRMVSRHRWRVGSWGGREWQSAVHHDRSFTRTALERRPIRVAPSQARWLVETAQYPGVEVCAAKI